MKPKFDEYKFLEKWKKILNFWLFTIPWVYIILIGFQIRMIENYYILVFSVAFGILCLAFVIYSMTKAKIENDLELKLIKKKER